MPENLQSLSDLERNALLNERELLFDAYDKFKTEELLYFGGGRKELNPVFREEGIEQDRHKERLLEQIRDINKKIGISFENRFKRKAELK